MKIYSACQACGKEIIDYPSRVRRFCSLACVGKRNTKNTNRVCDGCGKTYQPKRCRSAEEQKRNAQHFFCSTACHGKWASKNRVGKYAPKWMGGIKAGYYGPNWNEQKRAARKRDGYKCRHCGITQKKHGRALDVHHITPFRTFGYIPGTNDNYILANELTNLITLCKHCHIRAENRSIPIQLYLI